jgi:hypothetical protein
VEAALAVAYVVKVCGNFVGFAGAHWTGKVNLRDGVDLQFTGGRLCFSFPYVRLRLQSNNGNSPSVQPTCQSVQPALQLWQLR